VKIWRVQKFHFFPKNFQTSTAEHFRNSRKQKVRKIPSNTGPYLNLPGTSGGFRNTRLEIPAFKIVVFPQNCHLQFYYLNEHFSWTFKNPIILNDERTVWKKSFVSPVLVKSHIYTNIIDQSTVKISPLAFFETVCQQLLDFFGHFGLMKILLPFRTVLAKFNKILKYASLKTKLTFWLFSFIGIWHFLKLLLTKFDLLIFLSCLPCY